MDFYPFGFTVVIHDTYDPKTHTSTYRRESGMGLAQSYANAMEQLENYYGEDLIAVKHLELFSDDTIILLPEHIIQVLIKSKVICCFRTFDWFLFIHITSTKTRYLTLC